MDCNTMTLGKVGGGGGEKLESVSAKDLFNLVPIPWMDTGKKDPGDEVEHVVVEAFSRMIQNGQGSLVPTTLLVYLPF